MIDLRNYISSLTAIDSIWDIKAWIGPFNKKVGSGNYTQISGTDMRFQGNTQGEEFDFYLALIHGNQNATNGSANLTINGLSALSATWQAGDKILRISAYLPDGFDPDDQPDAQIIELSRKDVDKTHLRLKETFDYKLTLERS